MPQKHFCVSNWQLFYRYTIIKVDSIRIFLKYIMAAVHVFLYHNVSRNFFIKCIFKYRNSSGLSTTPQTTHSHWILPKLDPASIMGTNENCTLAVLEFWAGISFFLSILRIAIYKKTKQNRWFKSDKKLFSMSAISYMKWKTAPFHWGPSNLSLLTCNGFHFPNLKVAD